MADTDTQSEQQKDATPQGEAPQSHKDTDGPGMSQGVPDGADEADATAAPKSDRKNTETAGAGSKDG